MCVAALQAICSYETIYHAAQKRAVDWLVSPPNKGKCNWLGLVQAAGSITHRELPHVCLPTALATPNAKVSTACPFVPFQGSHPFLCVLQIR